MNKRVLLSHKKKGILLFAINLNGPRGHYAKWNKSDREIQIVNRNGIIYIHREQSGCCQRGEGEMTREMRERKRYKLSVMK